MSKKKSVARWNRNGGGGGGGGGERGLAKRMGFSYVQCTYV